jgi:hypothetical protein
VLVHRARVVFWVPPSLYSLFCASIVVGMWRSTPAKVGT